MLFLQTNSYQMVLATDGETSYTVFTYKCGELNWSSSSYRAVIGYNAASNSYVNHPLSRTTNVNSIACVNSPSSPWSNVVYNLNQS